MHPRPALDLSRAFCRLLTGAVAVLTLAGGIASAQPASQQPGLPSCAEPLPALFARVSPAVVSITAISINAYDMDHRLDRVMGSGIVIDRAGLVLSNAHVVFGRQILTVTLDDGVTLPAKFVGADPVFDVALLRIPTPTERTLPIATLGDSAGLVVGEDVYAIGSPLGLDQTLTRGIVSAINRRLPGAVWSLTEPLIQTDAAINPGNSGGPLVDACGRIVGITTAMLTEAQNIGFAVPINLVKDVVPQLLDKGRIVRPWFGVQGQFVAPELKELLRIELVDGFLVEAVEPGSPAEQKGLQGGLFELTVEGQPILLGGDIITGINGAPIDDPAKLAKALGALTVGSVLKVAFVREGKPQAADLTLTERPLLASDIPGRRSGAAPAGFDRRSSGVAGSASRTIRF
jgi:S1-C subfamily serine protease